MEEGIVKVSDRFLARNIENAIQGNYVKALVELITNSDDSYRRLEHGEQKVEGRIDVLYHKEDNGVIFTVRDFAEGMSLDFVRETCQEAAGNTSGMTEGKSVRGFFGLGSKQALGGMKDGWFCSFKDGEYVDCELYVDKSNPIEHQTRYTLNKNFPAGHVKATPELRKKYGIPENGTYVCFRHECARIPYGLQSGSIIQDFYMLRGLMCDEKRKIILIDSKKHKKQRLRHTILTGNDCLVETFKLEYQGWEMPVRVHIKKADKNLIQSGDERDGGLLILDEQGTVLDLSLFKYDAEPLASRLFGEIVIEGFRELLLKGEAILTDLRTGLAYRHPFCQKLTSELEKRIDYVIQKEKEHQEIKDSTFGREEADRYRRCFALFNNLSDEIDMEIGNEVHGDVGQTLTDAPVYPKNGMCFYPSIMNSTVSKQYKCFIMLDTKLVHHGSTIFVSCSNPHIQVTPTSIPVEKADGTGIIKKHISIEGDVIGACGTIIAEAPNAVRAEAQIGIAPPPNYKEELKENGMIFVPEQINMRSGQTRNALLWVDVKAFADQTDIKLTSDNKNFELSAKKIFLHHADAVRGEAQYKISITGFGVGEKGIISATAQDGTERLALLDVAVTDTEPRKPKNPGGIFREPVFSDDQDPRDDVRFSTDEGKVMIFYNFPTTKFYLGEKNCRRETLEGKFKIAELLCKCCFWELARKKVDESGLAANPVTRWEKIERESLEMKKKLGGKVLDILVGDLKKKKG